MSPKTNSASSKQPRKGKATQADPTPTTHEAAEAPVTVTQTPTVLAPKPPRPESISSKKDKVTIPDPKAEYDRLQNAARQDIFANFGATSETLQAPTAEPIYVSTLPYVLAAHEMYTVLESQIGIKNLMDIDQFTLAVLATVECVNEIRTNQLPGRLRVPPTVYNRMRNYFQNMALPSHFQAIMAGLGVFRVEGKTYYTKFLDLQEGDHAGAPAPRENTPYADLLVHRFDYESTRRAFNYKMTHPNVNQLDYHTAIAGSTMADAYATLTPDQQARLRGFPGSPSPYPLAKKVSDTKRTIEPEPDGPFARFGLSKDLMTEFQAVIRDFKVKRSIDVHQIQLEADASYPSSIFLARASTGQDGRLQGDLTLYTTLVEGTEHYQNARRIAQLAPHVLELLQSYHPITGVPNATDFLASLFPNHLRGGPPGTTPPITSVHITGYSDKVSNYLRTMVQTKHPP